MSNSFTQPAGKKNILKLVAGYEEGVARKNGRHATGTDKSEYKGKVSAEIAKLHPKRLHLKLIQIFEDTASTKTFRFVGQKGNLPPFQAGQYINLFVNINGVETARPYAISSCPTQRDYYDLTVKIVKNGFVSGYMLREFQVGMDFTATSPMGTFCHNPLFHGNDLVFLAGGSGGAPARSMILSALNQHPSIHYHLIYGNSYEDDVIFQREFRELANKFDQFTLTEVISRPTENYQGLAGHLSKDLIQQQIGDIRGKTFYVCGPTPFNEFCRAQLKALGVEDKRIRIECNGPPKNVSELEDWPNKLEVAQEVTVTVRGKKQFKAKVGEPLLNSMERNGLTMENACRSGECSLCRCKVVEGAVFNPPEAKLRKSDKEFGWVHACVAFPTEDIEIMY